MFAEFIIKPESVFGTIFKGDTLFGHLCWQFALDNKVAGAELKDLLSTYSSEPFLIVGTPVPVLRAEGKSRYFFTRPQVPYQLLFKNDALEGDEAEAIKLRKENKKKKWIESNSYSLSLLQNSLVDEKEILDGESFCMEHSRSHNSINRLYGSTTGADFAPFTQSFFQYHPDIELAVLCYLNDSQLKLQAVEEALQRVGSCGYGRDASTGAGRFHVVGRNDVEISSAAKDYYTLAPCVPVKDQQEELLFQPFVRYGKHGSAAALSGSPFKAPVIFADEGAIFCQIDKEQKEKSYVGRAVTGVSKVISETVTQGYSPCIPFFDLT